MTKTLTTLAVALALTLPALADDAHHPAQQSARPVAAAKAPVKTMQANLKKMQAQLARVASARTDEQRQKAMAEHMQTLRENMMLGQQVAGAAMDCPMHEGMGMMHEGGMDMMHKGGGMMGKGGGMGGGMTMDHQGGEHSQHEATMERLQRLEKRLDTMQSTLEQIKPQAAPLR